MIVGKLLTGPVLWGTCVLIATPAAGQADAKYRQTVAPLIQRHCADCHGSEGPEAELILTSTSDRLPAALREMKSLEAVAKRLRARSMPPPDAEVPLSEDNRRALIAWLDDKMDSLLGGVSNPGRVTIRRLTKVDYRNTIRDLLGLPVGTSEFPSDDIAHGFDNIADVISLPPLLMEHYLSAGEQLAGRWVQREIDSDNIGRAAAEQRLFPLMDRAFRRPATDLERNGLLSLYDTCRGQGFSHQESMQACVTKLLVAPAFLFRIENDGAIGQDRRLDDFELAARLSYFLWSSMPDEELFEVARRGELQESDNLARQIDRMLKDPKVRQGLVENFAGQWLQTRRLSKIRPDRKAFPEFDEKLREAMEQETLLLFEEIVREDLPVTLLLDADFSFLNERLAKHYGINGVKGNEFQRVSLQSQPRRGVLTHAGILAINSHPLRTSPVLRGKWIMEAILGTPPPPPVADADELEAVELKGTLRERLEVHRENKRCAGCHQQMDALGLAFEHYDPLGRWRTKDEGQPIDASGELGDGTQFNNALELIDVLRSKRSDDFRKSLVERMLVYGLGRTLGMYDRSALRQVVRQTEAGGDRISALVKGIADSEVFRYRRNPGRIGIEKLADHFVFELSGNPDQQALLTLRPNPNVAAPAGATKRAEFELHTLKPLLKASSQSPDAVAVGKPEGGPKVKQPYRYPITAPVGERIYLSFLEGMIGPQEYATDFLKPIRSLPETDMSKVENIGNSSHSWNGSLAGPGNVRPGALLSFDFDVRLVAKERDSLNVFLATPGGTNHSMFSSGRGFTVEGEGTHRLTRVHRRRPTTHDAWNNVITLVIKTQVQTVVGNISPLRVVRPKLGLSDPSPIRFENVAQGKAVESKPRRVYNAQEISLTDHEGTTWNSILYGTARLDQDPKRAYFYANRHVGAELLGEHADRFELLGKRVVEEGHALEFYGSDGKPGLEGGPKAEAEEFRVRFRGSGKAGTYRAVLRIVTQAGGIGTRSSGSEGEPRKELYYVDIPVEAVVN